MFIKRYSWFLALNEDKYMYNKIHGKTIQVYA